MSVEIVSVIFKQDLTQIVFQDIRVKGFPSHQSVVWAVWLNNVGRPGEQVELKGVQAEGCPAWTQPSL